MLRPRLLPNSSDISFLHCRANLIGVAKCLAGDSLSSMFFDVHFPRLFGVRARVRGVTGRGVSVVRSLLVIAGLVVCGGLVMMLCSLAVMLGRFGVMFRSFFGHGFFPRPGWYCGISIHTLDVRSVSIQTIPPIR
jgi:hypothetical protein